MSRKSKNSTELNLINSAALPCAKATTCSLINDGVTLLKRRHVALLGVQADPTPSGIVPKVHPLGSWHLAPLLDTSPTNNLYSSRLQ